MDVWKLKPATEAWTRDCGVVWFLGHGCSELSGSETPGIGDRSTFDKALDKDTGEVDGIVSCCVCEGVSLVVFIERSRTDVGTRCFG